MMNLRPFIKTHVKAIMTNFDHGRGPFDTYIREYYKQNRTLGPSERSIISQVSYRLIRYDLLLNQYTRDWDRKMELLNHISKYQEDTSLPLQDTIILLIEGMYDVVVLRKDYGEQKAFEYFNVLNEKAPLTIRVNPLKTSRDQLMKSMPQLYSRKTRLSPYGMIVSQDSNVNLVDTPQFKEGLFEIQDEASQICALRVECKPLNKVLDYCAGSGGKTLALAHQLEGKGLIEINDTRIEALNKAKLRLKRAGVFNYSLFSRKYKFDWILVDVPCTGVGTLRRNADQKYKFSLNQLEHLTNLQEDIFDDAMKYLKKDGKIVYCTCSFLKAENQKQIKKFCEKHGLKVSGNDYFQSLPESGNMDAFFSITLERV